MGRVVTCHHGVTISVTVRGGFSYGNDSETSAEEKSVPSGTSYVGSQLAQRAGLWLRGRRVSYAMAATREVGHELLY